MISIEKRYFAIYFVISPGESMPDFFFQERRRHVPQNPIFEFLFVFCFFFSMSRNMAVLLYSAASA